MLLLVPSLALLACATAPRERALPLDKLRLYETGVGYFERAGTLGGPKGASLPVPSGHLDDALKSLVVLGDDGTVRSVAFDSRQSPAVARARAGLPPQSDAPIRMHDVLLGLRGHEVVVRQKARRIRGRLIDVIGVPVGTDVGTGTGEGGNGLPTAAEQAGATQGKTFALLVTGTGRYRRVDVAKLDEITPVDPDVRTRMQAALDATVALRSNARGLLDVAGEGGPVRVGYLAEAPVWRASYRLVLAAKSDGGEAAALQGWALVHNDTEEDWDDVALELVNGRPDSFLFPLAAPRYERRELVVPDRELSSVPQLLDTTPDAMWGDFLDSEVSGGIGGTGYGGGTGSGSGYGGRGIRVPAVRQGITMGGSDLISVGDLSALATGEGHETKTVFVYGTAEPLDLTAGRSAMVPFVQTKVESAAITWITGFGDVTARHAVRVVNSTAQTLPEGTLAVFADGGFSGETMLPRLKPGERRFLGIGDDPDTEMTIVETTVDDTPQRLVWRSEQLQEHFLRRTVVIFDIVNRSGQARHVHVEVAAGSNTKLEGADRVDFDLDRGRPLAIFEVAPAGKIEARKVVIEEGLSSSAAFEGLTEDRLERLASATTLTDVERGAMKVGLERLQQQHAAQAEVERLRGEITVIEADIERLRGHLQAMAGEGDGGKKNPVVERLLATEDQLQARRKELDAASKVVEVRTTATRESLSALAPGQ